MTARNKTGWYGNVNVLREEKGKFGLESDVPSGISVPQEVGSSSAKIKNNGNQMGLTHDELKKIAQVFLECPIGNSSVRVWTSVCVIVRVFRVFICIH